MVGSILVCLRAAREQSLLICSKASWWWTPLIWTWVTSWWAPPLSPKPWPWDGGLCWLPSELGPMASGLSWPSSALAASPAPLVYLLHWCWPPALAPEPPDLHWCWHRCSLQNLLSLAASSLAPWTSRSTTLPASCLAPGLFLSSPATRTFAINFPALAWTLVVQLYFSRFCFLGDFNCQ